LEIVTLHYEPMPISLSDNAMDQIMVLTAPLVPTDRVAFMHSLAAFLKSKPAQPQGDGDARALLSSGTYRRQNQLATGISAARHHQQSRLRDGAPIRNSRSK
jgi:hypothetical protein